MKKILLIASNGGHYVQASRLAPAFENESLYVVSTSKTDPKLIEGKYYNVSDCNMTQLLSCIKCFIQCLVLAIRIRPDVVISTGAAPGLFMLLATKLTGSKGIWLDSIANTKELSKAGKYAKRITKHCYSQWEDVANEAGVQFIGAVI